MNYDVEYNSVTEFLNEWGKGDSWNVLISFDYDNDAEAWNLEIIQPRKLSQCSVTIHRFYDTSVDLKKDQARILRFGNNGMKSLKSDLSNCLKYVKKVG
jgi:hypothetical protein